MLSKADLDQAQLRTNVKSNPEVTVKKIKDVIPSRRMGGYHEDFNVFVDDKRMLSVFSDDNLLVAKWISKIHKACRMHKNSPVYSVLGSWDYMKYERLDCFLCYEIGMKYLKELSKLSSNCSSFA